MRVGIVPAPSCGLRTMAATGQLTRLTRHFTAYQSAGHVLTYFTGLPDDPPWIAQLVRPATPPMPHNGTRRALLLPLREARAFRQCRVLRATSLSAALSAMTARVVHGIPFVVSHGADYAAIAKLHRRPTWKWNALRRLAFRLASAVIVPNPAHAMELQAFFPAARIVHVPNWVDTQMFAPSPRPNGWPTVLYVGRLVIEKNLVRLAHVCRDHGWRLFCIGDGPQRGLLQSLGAECPGAVEWDDLPKWHAQAHVFCLPSYTEGLPKALLEAMSSGLPCAVSSAIVGVVGPHAVFPPASEPAMAEAINTLLKRGADLTGTRQAVLRYDIARVLPEEIRVVEEAAR